MERLLECSICFTTEGVPKIFTNCLHWFCETCIDNIAHDDHHISCPSCRDDIQLPTGGAKDLKTNFHILNLRDTVQSPMNVTTGMCSTEHDTAASHRCYQCCALYCQACSAEHIKLKSFHKHVLKDIRMMICPAHQRNYQLICEQCPRLLCVLCHQTICTDHHQYVFEIDEIKQDRKTHLSQIRDRLSTRLDSQETTLAPFLAQVKIQEEQANLDKMMLARHKEEVIRKIEEQNERFLKAIDLRVDTLSALKVQIQKQDQRSQLDTLLHASNQAIIGPAGEMILALNTIKQNIPEVETECSVAMPQRLQFYPNGIGNIGIYNHKHPNVFLEFSADDVIVGRVVLDLYSDAAPWSSGIFYSLCTGDIQAHTTRMYTEHPMEKRESFLGADISNVLNYSNGKVVYLCHLDRTGLDEKKSLQILDSGLLYMVVNKGKTDTVGISLDTALYTDTAASLVVFGKVLGDGISVLSRLLKGRTNSKCGKYKKIVISQCGAIV